MTARVADLNGYVTIAKNPISRSGVFQYLGKSIDKNAEPNRMYNVLRPDSELSDPEAVASFKMVPLVNDHTMLGDTSKGMLPAEQKGVHGVTGEDVEFRDGVLYATLRIFSEKLKEMIEAGKTALSLGYRCAYEKTSGVFNGQPYDYIQRRMRGNHIALVDAARCDVAVLDHSFAFDSFEISHNPKETEMTDEEKAKKAAEEKTAMDASVALNVRMTKALDWIDGQIAKDSAEKEAKKLADEKAVKDAADAEEAAKNAAMSGDSEEAKKMAADKAAKDKADKEKEGMDAAITSVRSELETFKKEGVKGFLKEVAQAKQLADELSVHVGTFDHSEMSLNEVAAYGTEKLGITVAKGQELAAVNGYLLAAGKVKASTFALDSSQKKESGEINAYLSGAAK